MTTGITDALAPRPADEPGSVPVAPESPANPVSESPAKFVSAPKPSRAKELVVTVLSDVPQALVMLRSHRLARRRTLKIEGLAGESMILPPRGRTQRAVLDAAFAAAGVEVHVAATAVGWDVLVRLVALGLGIAVVNASVRLPSGLVARPIRSLPGVRYVAVTRRSPSDRVGHLIEALARHGNAWRDRRGHNRLA